MHMTTPRKLWLDLGNTRLKYWLTEGEEIITSGAELHLQSPADLLLGLVDRFSNFQPSFVGVSSVLDTQANQRIKKNAKASEYPQLSSLKSLQHHMV